jgi:hypothetical protein
MANEHEWCGSSTPIGLTASGPIAFKKAGMTGTDRFT